MKFSVILSASLFFIHTATYSQSSVLRSGPMVGYGQMTEVLLWVQTTRPATVQYRYWNVAEPSLKMKSRAVKTSEEGSFIAKILIDGLKPGRKFEYELLLDGTAARRNYPLRFQTQALWQWRTDPPQFSVAFGSCLYVNEPAVDRPGRVYGSDYEILTVAASKNPDIFLWLGDNMYMREVDWDTRGGIFYRYSHTRQLMELQPLLGAVHHYAIWDDHDYGPNNADRSYRLRTETLDAFKLFWANQTYGTDETKGVFSRFVWNDVEFFMLDDRYYRSPNRSKDDLQKTMFGNDQLQWLKDALINSLENPHINFRVIVNGNQILNPNGEYYEALPQFSAEHRALLEFIKGSNIPGIFFISGDRHHTEMIVQTDSAMYPLYEFTSSPLTSGINTLTRDGVPTKEFYNPMRVEGTLVNDKHNFGMITFSGSWKERAAALECYDVTGALRWKKVINAVDLRKK